jgi:RNA polymerase sigma factor (sigma-70 family)
MRGNGGSVQVAKAIDGLVQSGTLVGLNEEELLARFVERRDPRAFEAIVDRHGPLVLAVCRQLLADPNDVEDAFQATFLVLIRKAGSVRRPGSLGSWLYGVAYRTALRLKRTSRPIRLLTDHVDTIRSCPTLEREEITLLHQEIDRLPEKYRQPIVLCYFEGLTHDDAAARLRWPVGTVRGRLARARDRLRNRLDRRGVSLSAALPGALDRLRAGSPALPQGLIRSTATLLEQSVSLRVSTLVQGVILTMLIEKLKWTLLALTASSLLLVVAGTGLRAIASQAEKKVDVDNVRQRKQEFSKQIDYAPTKASLPRAGLVAGKNEIEAYEKDADRLERHRVEAELLEIQLAALKSRIKDNLENIKLYESNPQLIAGFGGGVMTAGGAKNLDELSSQTDKMTRNYTESRLQLARLKRQIAREARALDQPATETDPAGLNRRFETLESKVDQILQRLPKDSR